MTLINARYVLWIMSNTVQCELTIIVQIQMNDIYLELKSLIIYFLLWIYCMFHE